MSIQRILLVVVLLGCLARGESKKCALATFVFSEDEKQLWGAAALGRSLQHSDTQTEMLLLHYSHKPLARGSAKALESYGWRLVDAKPLNSSGESVEAVLAQFYVWTLTQYDVIAYLDPTMVAAANVDELCHCNGSSLGGVPDRREHVSHTVGMLTLRPDLESYYRIARAVTHGDLRRPKELFDWMYALSSCVYFDPREGGRAENECVRLPARYAGDLIDRELVRWVDGELDEPKLVHYNVAGMEPWHWWAPVLLPRYWQWAEHYIAFVYDASVAFDFRGVWWLVLMVLCFVGFAGRHLFVKYVRAVWLRGLAEFHVCNALLLWGAFELSQLHVLHPRLDALLFVSLDTVFVSYLLLAHLRAGDRIAAVYFASQLLFFATMMQLPFFEDLVVRLLLVALWLVGWHGIYFTRLLCEKVYQNQMFRRARLREKLSRNVSLTTIVLEDCDIKPPREGDAIPSGASTVSPLSLSAVGTATSSSAPSTPSSSGPSRRRKKRSMAFLKPADLPTLHVTRDAKSLSEGSLTDRAEAYVAKVQRWTVEAMAEAEVMRYLSSIGDTAYAEYVVRFYGESCDGDTDRHVIAMERTSMWSMGDFVQRALPACRRPVLAQLAVDMMRGVWYIHRHSVVHRDLRPECFRLCYDGERYVCKLADLESAKSCHYNSSDLSPRVRDGLYSAPEVWRREPRFPQAPDVWSVGLLLCLFFSGQLPFDERDFPAAVIFAPLRLAYPSAALAVPYLPELLDECLHPDFRNRPSISECLQSSFVRHHPLEPLDYRTMRELMPDSPVITRRRLP